jgi:hypothetical protein
MTLLAALEATPRPAPSAPVAPQSGEAPVAAVTSEQRPQHEAASASGAALLFDILRGPRIERLDTTSLPAVMATAPSVMPAVREIEPPSPAGTAAAPRVDITIGSIDIIVAPAVGAPAPRPPAVAQPPSVQSLDQYLQSRQHRRGPR